MASPPKKNDQPELRLRVEFEICFPRIWKYIAAAGALWWRSLWK
jgi:hypothetical protein